MKVLVVVGVIVSMVQSGNNVSDNFGNKGIGEMNTFSGRGNKWQGNKNTIIGVNNGIIGNRNNVKGNQNEVVGHVNKVFGEKNLVRGSNNIIINDYLTEKQIKVLPEKVIQQTQLIKPSQNIEKDFILSSTSNNIVKKIPETQAKIIIVNKQQLDKKSFVKSSPQSLSHKFSNKVLRQNESSSRDRTQVSMQNLQKYISGIKRSDQKIQSQQINNNLNKTIIYQTDKKVQGMKDKIDSNVQNRLKSSLKE